MNIVAAMGSGWILGRGLAEEDPLGIGVGIALLIANIVITLGIF